MTKTEEDKMKQWKLVLVALLAVLLVCTCTSVMAEECAHERAVEIKGDLVIEALGDSYHKETQYMDSYCPDCKMVVKERVSNTSENVAHQTITVTDKAATCTAAGSEHKECVVCDYKFAATTVAKKDHTWSYAPVKATCTVAAHNHYTCKVCGFEADFDFSGEALGHAWNPDIVVKPTCTDKGYTYNVCSRCDAESGKRNYVDAGHAWGKDIVVKPTCTAKGYTHKVCEVCGADSGKFAETAMTDHSPVKEFSIVPTCTTKGETVTACQFCGKEFERKVVGVIPHTYKGTTVPSTCTEEGTFTTACTVCGAIDKANTYPLAKAAHEWVNHKAVDWTCGKDGNEAYTTCANCDIICDKNGHVISKIPVVKAKNAEHDWLVANKVAATCEKAGKIEYVCRHCEEKKSETTPVLDHCYSDTGWVTVKAPTCHETGIKKNACTICGGFEKVEEIPTTGHKFATGEELKYNGTGDIAGGKGKVTKAATCTKEGAATVICVTCNKVTKNIVIPAHGHIWGNWDYSAQPTCTTAMTAWRTCKSCGEKETQVVADKLGHAWVITKGTAATCEKDGKVDRYCPICDTTETGVKVPATGHNLVWETVSQPTAAADGVKELACTVCDYVAETKVIPYTVMRYSNTATAFGPCTRDLVGGSEWARVTPIDLSVEGTFTYPLIASNQYVIGTVTVTIANGTATVNYDTAAAQIKVTSEALLIYADKAALAAGTAQEYAFGAPIQIGEDTKVILSVLLTVDYDAVGAGVTGFAADEAQIEAMKAIMD